MKKFSILIILLIFTLCGCTSSVKEDLIRYINYDMNKPLEIQKENIAQYEKFFSVDNYSYDELYDIVNNYLIPNYENLINELNSIKLNTKEVQKIHDIFIKGTEKQLDALYKIKQGSKSKNKEIIKEGNEKIKEANSYFEMYKKELFELSNKYQLKYTK